MKQDLFNIKETGGVGQLKETTINCNNYHDSNKQAFFHFYQDGIYSKSLRVSYAYSDSAEIF